MSTQGVIYRDTFKTLLGALTIGVYQDKVCLLDWSYRRMRQSIDSRIANQLDAVWEEAPHPLHEQVKEQVHGYLKKERKVFDFPLILAGTDFQKQVWKALQQIPFGKTTSYLELAQKLDNEKAVRAVAAANGANALALVIPCHRVIGGDGSLVGYAGGLAVKKRLLQLEGALHKGQLSLFA